MEEFLRSYGLWILLGGVFFAMHWLGMGCGGRHDHGAPRKDERDSPEGTEKRPARSGHAGGCH